jgi:lactate dehydrogenase-like 2-hydroxyacid dehydrogenase
VSRVLQIVRLPLPSAYQVPADLPLTEAFDADALAAIDPAAVEVIVTHSIVGMPADLWARFPNLRLIANLGVGLDRLDLEEARRRGISVTYTPNHLTADVADLAIGFMIALLRNIGPADRFLRQGGWSSGQFRLGTSISSRKLGILGLGRIGTAIANRAAAFGVEVAYSSRNAKPDAGLRHFDSGLALAQWADILVAALPGGAETDGLVSREVLEALGPDGLFINVARASVVDEAALVDAIHQGKIAGAGLELFSAQSPLIEQLTGTDNVLMTPHIGSATLQTRMAMGDAVFANVRAALDGKPLVDCAT